MSETFVCDFCGGVFEKNMTEEESLKECEALFGEESKGDLAIVCDDCFKAIVPIGGA